jgi:hypothetical protein
VVILDGAVLGDDVRASEILAGFRTLGPLSDSWERVPAASIVRMHMDPEGPTPAVGRGTLLDVLDEATLRAFVTAVGPDAQTSILMAELRQLGGALSRTPLHGGAMATMPGAFAAYFVSVAATPEMAARGAADIDVAVAALSGAENGRQYLNLAERPVDSRMAFGDEGWLRLLEIRDRVDPRGLFVGNHQIRH